MGYRKIVVVGVLSLLVAAVCGACSEDVISSKRPKPVVSRSKTVVETTTSTIEDKDFAGAQDRFAEVSALQRDVFEQKAISKVDILWIVDNSGSMQEEQAKLAQNFNRFISYLIQTNVEYHIGVVTTDTASPGFSGKLQAAQTEAQVKFLTPQLCDQKDCELLFGEMVQQGTSGSPTEKGLQAGMLALTPPNVAVDYDQCGSAPNGCFFRPEANLAVVLVSDEEDSSLGDLGYYVRFYEGLKGYGNGDEVTFSAVAGDPPDPTHGAVGGCITQNTTGGNIGQECSSDAQCGGGACITGIFRKYCSLSCQSSAMCPQGWQCLEVQDPTGTTGFYCKPDSEAAPGTRYNYVAKTTGGIFESICSADFNIALGQLGFTVSGLKREFPLSRAPNVATLIVYLQRPGEMEEPVAEDVDDGWSYNSTNNSIVFGKNLLPPQFSVITVTYRVAGGG